MVMDWRAFIGKKVFLKTYQGYIYSGVVTEVDNSIDPIIFINFIDKFGKLIAFSNREIVEIREERY